MTTIDTTQLPKAVGPPQSAPGASEGEFIGPPLPPDHLVTIGPIHLEDFRKLQRAAAEHLAARQDEIANGKYPALDEFLRRYGGAIPVVTELTNALQWGAVLVSLAAQGNLSGVRVLTSQPFLQGGSLSPVVHQLARSEGPLAGSAKVILASFDTLITTLQEEAAHQAVDVCRVEEALAYASKAAADNLDAMVAVSQQVEAERQDPKRRAFLSAVNSRAVLQVRTDAIDTHLTGRDDLVAVIRGIDPEDYRVGPSVMRHALRLLKLQGEDELIGELLCHNRLTAQEVPPFMTREKLLNVLLTTEPPYGTTRGFSRCIFRRQGVEVPPLTERDFPRLALRSRSAQVREEAYQAIYDDTLRGKIDKVYVRIAALTAWIGRGGPQSP